MLWPVIYYFVNQWCAFFKEVVDDYPADMFRIYLFHCITDTLHTPCLSNPVAVHTNTYKICITSQCRRNLGISNFSISSFSPPSVSAFCFELSSPPPFEAFSLLSDLRFSLSFCFKCCFLVSDTDFRLQSELRFVCGSIIWWSNLLFRTSNSHSDLLSRFLSVHSFVQ